MLSAGIGLRHLCDWIVFENSLSDNQFCEMFEIPLKRCGLWRFAQLLTQCGIRFLNAPSRNWAGDNENDLTEAMICDVMSGGNL